MSDYCPTCGRDRAICARSPDECRDRWVSVPVKPRSPRRILVTRTTLNRIVEAGVTIEQAMNAPEFALTDRRAD